MILLNICFGAKFTGEIKIWISQLGGGGGEWGANCDLNHITLVLHSLTPSISLHHRPNVKTLKMKKQTSDAHTWSNNCSQC